MVSRVLGVLSLKSFHRSGNAPCVGAPRKGNMLCSFLGKKHHDICLAPPFFQAMVFAIVLDIGVAATSTVLGLVSKSSLNRFVCKYSISQKTTIFLPSSGHIVGASSYPRPSWPGIIIVPYLSLFVFRQRVITGFLELDADAMWCLKGFNTWFRLFTILRDESNASHARTMHSRLFLPKGNAASSTASCRTAYCARTPTRYPFLGARSIAWKL